LGVFQRCAQKASNVVVIPYGMSTLKQF